MQRFLNLPKNVKLVCLLMVAVIVPNRSHCGEYAVDFLRIGVGARASALGSAFTAIADDASACYWNPAGLAQTGRLQVQFGHVPMFNNLARYNFGVIALGLGSQIYVSAAWIRLGVEDIPRYSVLPGTRASRYADPALRSNGIADGYFSDSENAFLLSFSQCLQFELGLGGGFAPILLPGELYWGLTYKNIWQKLDVARASGHGIDAGILIKFYSQQQLNGDVCRLVSIGVMVRDVSKTTMTWNTCCHPEDRLEPHYRVGLASSQLVPKLATKFTLTMDKEFANCQDWHFGGEALLFNTLALRTGFSNRRPVVGAGIRVFALRMDYAMVGHELGCTHRITGVLDL